MTFSSGMLEVLPRALVDFEEEGALCRVVRQRDCNEQTSPNVATGVSGKLDPLSQNVLSGRAVSHYSLFVPACH